MKLLQGRGRTVATTVLAPVSWGTTYLTVTELLPPGRPLLVAAGRVVPAGLALTVFARRRAPWRPDGRAWVHTGVLALCNFALFFPLLAVAVYRLPGGVAASMGGLQPLLVSTMHGALERRRPPTNDLALGALAVIGVSLVVLRPGASFDSLGILAAAAANVSFAAGVVLTRRVGGDAPKLASTGWQLLLASAVLVPLSLAVEGAPPAPTIENVAGFAYLGLVGTALAFVVWFDGVRRLPAAAPPLLGLAAPITGAGLGWVALGQALSPRQTLGFALTVGAIAAGAAIGARASAAARAGHARLAPSSAGAANRRHRPLRHRPAASTVR